MKKLFFIISTFGILLGLTACNTEHTHNIVKHEYKDPTCTEVGHEAYEECTECDYTTYVKIEALGHNLEYYELEESSCTEVGHKAYEKCTECDYTTYVKIEALGHDLKHYELEESSCIKEGTKEYWWCSECESKFADEEGTKAITDVDLKIDKKEHIDENNDYLCDYDCGEILITNEKLQAIIEDTLSSTKMTVKEWHIPSATRTSYYIDDNLLYINVDEGQEEKYYYTEEGTTYFFTKPDVWTKEITTESINYNVSYLFDSKYNLEISSEIVNIQCEFGSFEGENMFRYVNSLGTYISLKLNEEGSLLEGILIHDENNNIINEFVLTFGENEEVVNTFENINNYIEGYKFNESLNTYYIYTPKGLLEAIDKAETTGTVDNPATIKLMDNVEVEAIATDAFGINIEYGVLIESGNIILDLNGYQLSSTNNPYYVIQIGTEWGEICDAIITIEDSSNEKTGKIFASISGIHNNGGTLILNNGTIEVNNSKNDATAGISFYKGSVTINGGKINVTGVSENRITTGVHENGAGGTFIMNGGSINVNSPQSEALYLRGTSYINGGTIECNGRHIYGVSSTARIYLGTNEEGIGVTFIGGINSGLTLNSLLTEGVGYYDSDGNLIEVTDEAKEILDKGDITVKKVN